MLNMIKGCRIHDPSVLNEGYEITDYGFVANIDADKIQALFESFIKLHNDMCFLVLEVPTNAKEETAFSSDGASALHKDVYYLDGLTPDRAVELLNVFGKWLINDGLRTFGFGIHSGGHEILSGKYNVITVYARDKEIYKGFFEKCGIPQVRELKTAWDFFTASNPGDSFAYSFDGTNIYGLVEHLKRYGLYFAERREA